MLNCISTIDQATAGQIYVNGTDVTKMNEKSLARFRRERLGFIFQDFNLLDTLTGRDNIALALAITGESPKVIDRKVDEVSKALGVWEIIDKYPYEMSGGQRQRIACARAIVTRPSLILAATVKGKGISFMEGRNTWHGKAINDEEYARAKAELGGAR